jgi:hypothetical protein
MLSWYQWLIFAIVPPLIFLLYFLKLRRVPLEVPSTYLWSKTVEDLHVNSLWQKLRKNLLLWLQLLAVALLALSCFNPGCDGTELKGERFIFVVDRSASMSATDTVEGVSRLEEAKDQICVLIGQMDSTDSAMVISFSDDAQVEQSYTNTKSILKQKVRAIVQTQRGSDLKEALLAASGLANPGRTSDQESEVDVQVAEALDAKMLIFTDGAFNKIDEFRMGNLSAEYHPVGSPAEPPANIGITAFSISDQLDSDGEVQVFARLQNSGLADQQVSVSLRVDGELADAKQVEVGGLNSTTLNFDLTADTSGVATSIPIELKIDADDCYLQDNKATAVLNPPRRINVLVLTDDRMFFELAMTTDRLQKFANVQFELREFVESEEFSDNSLLGTYDLIVFDQCQPKTMPLCSTIFFGSLPPADWKEIKKLETAPIIDVNQTHPVMFDVQMSRVNILEAIALKAPQGGLDLLQSTEGTLMAICPRGSYEDLVIGFPLSKIDEDGESTVNTDWPRLLSFPIFVQNAMLTLGGASQFGRSRDYSPGQLVQLKPRFPYPEIRITNPQGKSKTLQASVDNQFIYGDTDQRGVYSVAGADEDSVDHLFTVNLLDRQESNLAVRENIGLGLEEIAAQTGSQIARKDLWVWLVLACLVVITIEWLIYNKRVFI